jgi:hypothetical protein
VLAVAAQLAEDASLSCETLTRSGPIDERICELSHDRISATHALALSLAALALFAIPLVAVAAFAIFLSVATRNSAAAIVGALVYALAQEALAAFVHLDFFRHYLLSDQLDGWHGLFQTPTFWTPSCAPSGSRRSSLPYHSSPPSSSSPAETSPANRRFNRPAGPSPRNPTPTPPERQADGTTGRSMPIGKCSGQLRATITEPSAIG